MAKAPTMRVRLTDETSLDLPENEFIQVVTAGPSETQEEGFVRLNPKERKKALYGKLSRVRAASLNQGQHIVTYRGILQIDTARRL
ncbi:MAG: hypothetical protein HOP13_07195 [Alphaproteobacteria bacterium]|nr:hypothetical protein [Alphaproteobacteria bacterium]